MKKSHFSNPIVYWLVILFLSLIMLWNIYAIFVSGRLIGLLTVGIQVVLLGLILTKNQYAKIGIIVWTIVFMVLASGLQFVGRLIKDAAYNFAQADVKHYISTGITMLIGVLIVVLVRKTVHIVEVEA